MVACCKHSKAVLHYFDKLQNNKERTSNSIESYHVTFFMNQCVINTLQGILTYHVNSQRRYDYGIPTHYKDARKNQLRYVVRMILDMRDG